MKIIQAMNIHKEKVLTLLDQFIDELVKISGVEPVVASTSASDGGGDMYDYVVLNNFSTIFLLEDDDGNLHGVIEICVLPKIRRGTYFAEIETMYVADEHQGKGYGKKLMQQSILRLKNNHPLVTSLRLSSGMELSRAHAFYEKMGFKKYAYTYKMKF